MCMVPTAIMAAQQHPISAANLKLVATMSVPVVAVKSSKSAMERPVKADLQSMKQRFIFNLR